MKIEASAGRQRKKGLCEHCERLALKAGNEGDAKLLAVLYGWLVHGRDKPMQELLGRTADGGKR